MANPCNSAGATINAFHHKYDNIQGNAFYVSFPVLPPNRSAENIANIIRDAGCPIVLIQHGRNASDPGAEIFYYSEGTEEWQGSMNAISHQKGYLMVLDAETPASNSCEFTMMGESNYGNSNQNVIISGFYNHIAPFGNCATNSIESAPIESVLSEEFLESLWDGPEDADDTPMPKWKAFYTIKEGIFYSYPEVPTVEELNAATIPGVTENTAGQLLTHIDYGLSYL